MSNRIPFAPQEWYHCYNRGVDKRKVFYDKLDYERFLLLLLVCNSTRPIHLSNLRKVEWDKIFAEHSLEHGEPLVEIGSYCLMLNHWHMILQETREGGIALFMQKVITAYTMYFNKRRKRDGPLFSGVFKSKHLYNDRYIKRAITYVHLNPIELIEPHWKQGRGNITSIEKYLSTFPYSSLPDFNGEVRLQRKILGNTVFDLYDNKSITKEIITGAQEYYQEINWGSK